MYEILFLIENLLKCIICSCKIWLFIFIYRSIAESIYKDAWKKIRTSSVNKNKYYYLQKYLFKTDYLLKQCITPAFLLLFHVKYMPFFISLFFKDLSAISVTVWKRRFLHCNFLYKMNRLAGYIIWIGNNNRLQLTRSAP